MSTKILFVGFLFISIVLLGCKKHEAMNQNEVSPEQANELISKAKKYIEEKRPEWKEAFKNRAFVVDKGDYWLVSFTLPEEVAGGVPEIRISKKTNEVVSSRHSQ